MILQLALGLLVSGLIGGLGFWRGSLSGSGWLGAVLVGTITFGMGGWLWGGLIIVFFAASSALSRLGRARKARIGATIWEKAGRRDLRQVLANGGVATLAALLNSVWPAPGWWLLAVGSVAAANADTWSTEIGVLSKAPPRHLLSWRLLAPGTSGGVSPLGFGAALAGAALISGVAALGWPTRPPGSATVALAGMVGGFGGALIDSLLGATLQERRWCAQCAAPTEQRIHLCGQPALRRAGLAGLDNDAVNALSTLAGGILTVLLGLLVS